MARPLRRAALAAGVLACLAACGTSTAESSTATGAVATSEPAEVAHAFGTTQVPADPERVVTWGWGSADAAIALGVVPVAIPTQTYGGDEQGVLPWIRERLEKDGKDLPTILPDAEEAPVEAIAAARPDLILAPYPGLTEAEYAQLS